MATRKATKATMTAMENQINCFFATLRSQLIISLLLVLVVSMWPYFTFASAASANADIDR